MTSGQVLNPSVPQFLIFTGQLTFKDTIPVKHLECEPQDKSSMNVSSDGFSYYSNPGTIQKIVFHIRITDPNHRHQVALFLNSKGIHSYQGTCTASPFKCLLQSKRFLDKGTYITVFSWRAGHKHFCELNHTFNVWAAQGPLIGRVQNPPLTNDPSALQSWSPPLSLLNEESYICFPGGHS